MTGSRTAGDVVTDGDAARLNLCTGDFLRGRRGRREHSARFAADLFKELPMHWKTVAFSAAIAAVVVVAFAKSNTLRSFVGLPTNA